MWSCEPGTRVFPQPRLSLPQHPVSPPSPSTPSLRSTGTQPRAVHRARTALRTLVWPWPGEEVLQPQSGYPPPRSPHGHDGCYRRASWGSRARPQSCQARSAPPSAPAWATYLPPGWPLRSLLGARGPSASPGVAPPAPSVLRRIQMGSLSSTPGPPVRSSTSKRTKGRMETPAQLNQRAGGREGGAAGAEVLG